MGFVIGIGIANIEGQILIRIGIHLSGRDRIETFGNLTIAFLDLGAQLARPAAHREGLEQCISAIGLHLPDFKLSFFFIGADENGRMGIRALFTHQR